MVRDDLYDKCHRCDQLRGLPLTLYPVLLKKEFSERWNVLCPGCYRTLLAMMVAEEKNVKPD